MFTFYEFADRFNNKPPNVTLLPYIRTTTLTRTQRTVLYPRCRAVPG